MRPLIEFCHNSKIFLKLSPACWMLVLTTPEVLIKQVLSTASSIIDFIEVLNLVNSHKQNNIISIRAYVPYYRIVCQVVIGPQ